MRLITKYIVLAIIALVGFGCSEDNVPDYRNPDYGYVQFKLYKEASYQDDTRAVKGVLDYLGEACKVKVTLSYGGTTITQTLNLSAADDKSAEFGLRSDKLRLLTGDYTLIAYTLYDTLDEELYVGTVPAGSSFSVQSDALVMHDITVNVTPRGSARFTIKKDMSDFSNEPTRAVTREYTLDEARYVSLTVGRVLSSGSVTNPQKIERMPAEFYYIFDEDNEHSDKEGYRLSELRCDSLVQLPAGNYAIVAYELYDESKNLLENNTKPKEARFSVEDNKTTDADVFVTLYQSDEYIKDYYALYEIWKSLNGEKWYYIGEEYNRGTNWDFNKDPDLWGDQPGVELHSNGRVARIDISDFAFSGDLSPAIGQLKELVKLYLGTHNDNNLLTYDPTLESSLSERKQNRLALHGEYLHMIHPATQFTEPCARALAEHNISIRATELFQSMSESQIFDMKSGKQREIVKMDTNFGTICNGLKSLPKEIGELENLEYLYIANSEISSIPDEIANLVSCTDVEIYNCPNLKEFPMGLTKMPELVSLNLSNNAQWSAEEVYKGMDALAKGPANQKIQILYARQNNLEQMPESFCNLSKLSLLDMAYNKISKLPILGKGVSFVQLYLDHNLIEEVPHDENGVFCGYDDVETFSMSYNRIKKFPNIFSANSRFSLTSVDFSGNLIDGFEGEEDGSYRGIKVGTLTLASNPKLTKYPVALAKSNSSVDYIILRGCNIDTIPEGSFTYENSVNLMSLDLSYNNLEKLPWEMHAGNLPYLYGVELSFNCFSSFPYEPLDSSGLTVFAIRSQRNQKGERCLREWPTGIYRHTGLRGLYLGSNDLRKIEDTISTLCYYLDISDNPNIIFDASDICYAWRVGAYILIYDKSQNIINCDYMLD